MSHPNVYIDLDNLPTTTIHLKVGQSVMLIRVSRCGGGTLHARDFPDSHFTAGPPATYGMPLLPGQPSGTYLISRATAKAIGSGNILVQMGPGNPMEPPFSAVLLPFTVS